MTTGFKSPDTKEGSTMTESPTFIARFADGQITRMTVYCEPGKLDVGRGMRLAMVEERAAGNVTAGIMLTHNYTDTSWFHEASEIADAACFTRGRIAFLDSGGTPCTSPAQGQTFFYFGEEREAFAAKFEEIGTIWTPLTYDDGLDIPDYLGREPKAAAS
jgi:hypothetical protein